MISLIAAMLQSRLEDRPFVGAIITRLEAMLIELGVPVGGALVHLSIDLLGLSAVWRLLHVPRFCFAAFVASLLILLLCSSFPHNSG
jgi:hypothetical protein